MKAYYKNVSNERGRGVWYCNTSDQKIDVFVDKKIIYMTYPESMFHTGLPASIMTGVPYGAPSFTVEPGNKYCIYNIELESNIGSHATVIERSYVEDEPNQPQIELVFNRECRYNYTPKKDITAFELAKIHQFFLAPMSIREMEAYFKHYDLMRHLTRI